VKGERERESKNTIAGEEKEKKKKKIETGR
jgi:hypothetical protein